MQVNIFLHCCTIWNTLQSLIYIFH